MIIGAPMGASSRYRVSLDHQLVCSYLIVRRRGHYSRWKASPVSLVSRATILCKYYCSCRCKCTFQPANSLRVDGIAAPVAPSTRRIVKGILSTDEQIDREGRGECY